MLPLRSWTGIGLDESPLCEQLEPRLCLAATAANIVYGDFTGDHIVDFVTTRGGLKLRAGNGDGTYKAPVPIGGNEFARGGSVGAADFNGDGTLDVAVFGGTTATGSAQRRSGGLFEFLNNGGGTFGSRMLIGHPTVNGTRVTAGTITTGDFNLDGDADVLVSTGVGANGTPTSFNATGGATPFVGGVAPPSGTTGTGFGGPNGSSQFATNTLLTTTNDLTGPTAGNSLGTGTTDLLGGMSGGSFIGTTGTTGPFANTTPQPAGSLGPPAQGTSTGFLFHGNGNGTFQTQQRVKL
jgi:hypothetical protein